MEIICVGANRKNVNYGNRMMDIWVSLCHSLTLSVFRKSS
jgi:hypothetical protein